MRTTSLISLVAVFGANGALLGCGDSGTTTGSGGAGTGGAGQGGSTTTMVTTTTTSSSTGGAGTGGAGGSATAQFSDDCPPDTLSIGIGSTTITGSTAAPATSGFTTFCADTAGTTADVVIALDLASDCTLELNLNDVGAFDGVLSIRKAQCTTRVAGDVCLNSAADNELYKTYAAAGLYYVVVDGANGSVGDFSLGINCSAPACGDGVVDPSEECDSGPGVTPNDGCGDVGQANECNVEAQVGSPTCPGTAVTIDLNDTAYFPPSAPTYSTIGSVDDYINVDMETGPCFQEIAAGGPEQVFEITPTASGTLTVRTAHDAMGASPCGPDPMNPDFSDPFCVDRVLYIRSGPCATGTQLACTNINTTTWETSVSTAVVAGTPYYVFVDGYNTGAAGPYVLEVNLVP